MAKQRKKEGAEGAAENGNGSEAALVVRHQKLCLAIDMEHEAIIGHTEMQVVAGKNTTVAELHSGGVEVSHVFIDGVAAKFEKKPSNAFQETSPRLNSLQDAANSARSQYMAALESEYSSDLFVTLSSTPANSEKDSTQENAKTPESQDVKVIQVQFVIKKPRSSLFFKAKIFQTHCVQHWFPCLASFSSRCSYHMEFTANCDYVAVSAGSLLYQVSCKEDARLKTYVYSLQVPTPACFITLVVAPLEIVPDQKNSSISHFCSPGYLSKLQSSVNCYHSLFSLYEDYLGYPFPFGCYKQVFIKAEHAVDSMSVGASMVTLSSHLLVDERIIDQAIITQIKLAQGLAQQWFGVFVTPETDRDVWLLEGISGFLVHQFIRKFLGNNEAFFRKYKAFAAVTEADIENFPPLSPSSVSIVAYRAEHLGLLGKIRFWKSVAVMQMLEKKMGQEHFRKVLQTIVLKAREGKPTLSNKDFKQLAMKVGNLERPFFKEFFVRWVECHGCPLLRMAFEYNKKRNLVELSVHRDCTAPGVIISGNKYIADVGWPGMMNIQIHELDGMFDHPNLSLSGDVHQLLELPCHSKIANRRPARSKKSSKVEIIDDLADDKPGVESPLLWLRADPGMDYLAKIQLFQPEHMWINQLEKDRDVVAQTQAIKALQKLPNSFAIANALNGCLIDSKVFCRVRIEAAFALANTATEATSWAGLGYLMKFYKSRCFDAEIGLPKSNSFHDFSEYFVLQAIPPAVASVRGNQGKSPPEAVEFLLTILKHNDNSSNAYSDSYWLSSIIEAVGELEVGSQSMPKFARILKQIDRYLQYDRLMPSFNYILTRSCIRTMTRLGLKFSALLSMESLEKLLSPYRNVHTPWQIRVAALKGFLDIRFQSQGLNSTLSLALELVNEDKCARVQTKLMAHALKMCLWSSTSAVDGPTVSSLLDMFGSEACSMNAKLRHHIFTILQALAGKPATLLRRKLPPNAPAETTANPAPPEHSRVKVIIPLTRKEPPPDQRKVGKLTLRLKANTAAPDTATRNSESETTGNNNAVRAASSSNQVAENCVHASSSDKMETDENNSQTSTHMKSLVEIIDVKPAEDVTLDVKPAESVEILGVKPAQDIILDVEPTREDVILDVKPVESVEILDVKPADSVEILDVKPADSVEILDVKPPDSAPNPPARVEIIDVKPTEDVEVVDVKPPVGGQTEDMHKEKDKKKKKKEKKEKKEKKDKDKHKERKEKKKEKHKEKKRKREEAENNPENNIQQRPANILLKVKRETVDTPTPVVSTPAPPSGIRVKFKRSKLE